ncbi:nucleotide-binding domain-containing protein [Gonapodya prolifera JEL478]|uniref:Nucleotide-binding domain-containing protein n=1 Tax=Gonapodya prolifera (strain JEL478) TaxID=1344416 RepID=A0A139AZC8_GONPJ|nr:nucleotide-binding domain-containing protein [Gonapodya prolifera JEL478]|eukprot:KXS22064.1 nucleotide-binding domain-containing protein [Gonapodya prolifera JEL478]
MKVTCNPSRPCDSRQDTNTFQFTVAMPSVVVVGCGVIGLSTALVAKGRGYDVTIISLATPDDTSSDPNYTSDNATTHWRSSADFAPVAVRERQRQWDKQTFQTLWLLAADPVKLPNGNLGPRDPKSAKGISKVTERHVFPSKPHGWTEPFYKRFIPNFRYLKPADLPKGMKFGFEYTTVSIHPDQYLGYLLRSFRALGGKVVSGVKVASLSEIVERGFDVVVNCTGIGAASLTSTSSSNTTLDSNVYAVRGHNVLIKAPHCTQSTMADPTYIIPLFDGEGTVCVVGTYQPKEGERGEGEMVASMLWKASQLDPAIVVSSEANLLGQNKTMGWLNDDDDDGEDEDVEHGDLFDERAESEEENLEYSEPTSSLDHPLGTSEHLPVTSAAPPRWQQASPNHISSSTVDESHFEEELEPQSLPETEDSSDLTDAVEEEVEHATNPMPGDGEQEMSAGSSVEHALQDEESLDPDHAPDEFSEKKTKSMDHESEERASHGNDDFAKDDHEEEGVECEHSRSPHFCFLLFFF